MGLCVMIKDVITGDDELLDTMYSPLRRAVNAAYNIAASSFAIYYAIDFFLS